MKLLLICTLFYLALSSRSHFRPQTPYYRVESIHSEKPIVWSNSHPIIPKYQHQSSYDPSKQNGVVIIHLDDADNELIARSPPPNFFYKWNLINQALLKKKLEGNNDNLQA